MKVKLIKRNQKGGSTSDIPNTGGLKLVKKTETTKDTKKSAVNFVTSTNNNDRRKIDTTTFKYEIKKNR